MGKIVQEKFQTTEPYNLEGVETGRWLDDKSARVRKGNPAGNGGMFNSLAPAMDIEDQETSDIRQHRGVVPGQSDYSQDVLTPAVARRGFRRLAMQPTDGDVGEGLLYREIAVENSDGQPSTGFLERGNLMDRDCWAATPLKLWGRATKRRRKCTGSSV
jgi:hypothetical protein